MALAPPAARDGFSFAAGDFYVEASGHNRHRRATIPEIQALFKSPTDAKDNPAHWYEAQLLHYGLKPSKTKGTAKMRLFEATSTGKLVIPAHIAKVEADLKKEWSKAERDAKQALKNQSLSSSPAKKGTNKRKLDDGADSGGVRISSMSIKPNGAVDIQFSGASKKLKTTAATTSSKAKPASKPKAKSTTAATTTTTTTKTKAGPKPKTEPKPKAGAKTKTTATKPSTKPAAAPSPAKAKAQATSSPAKKAPASGPRGGARGGASVARRTPSSSKTTANPPAKPTAAGPRTKQTARRGGKFWGSSMQPPASPPSNGYYNDNYDNHDDDDDDYDEAPPPYPGPPLGYGDDSDSYAADAYYGGYHSDEEEEEEEEEEDDDEPAAAALPPLGLLNGRYEIRSQSIEDEHDQAEGDFGLILTLEGNALWGSFDFGALHGILFLDERPWQSSREQLHFSWRGRDDEGYRFSGDNGGCISFLGDGEIHGTIDWDNGHAFGGWRISGQETRSEISAASMSRQWNDLRY